MMKTRRTRTTRRPAARRARPSRSRPRSKARVLRARDLMTRGPITVREELTIGDLCDLLQEKNINGAPVVDGAGRLVGVVTQEDIIYGAMGHPDDGSAGGGASPRRAKPGRAKRVVAILRQEGRLGAVPPAPPRPGERPFWSDEARSLDSMRMPVRSIMTSPAISAEEDTPVDDLCRIMWSLKIHRVPILKKGRVTGLVSSMDLCRAILEGTIRTR